MKQSFYYFILAFSILSISNCSTTKEQSSTTNFTEKKKKNTTSYTKDIKPLLDRSCMPCHAQGNKNDLNVLDTYKAVSKDIIDILQLVQLPKDEKMFMPYKVKKQPLSAKEIELIKKWVNEGTPE